ncbi:MAG TPA: DsbA family oxidoreductase [Kofleriaceae bacterium]|nr:DsbA family oxidoreductase [Kofleriaceae bacterium]
MRPNMERVGFTSTLGIDIWSDIVCPWCYIGKRRFEAALAKFSHAADVEVTFHSFELDPRSVRVHEGNHVEYLSKKFRVSAAQAQQMIDRVTANAAEAGLEFHLDRARGGNTFDAHRLLHLAKARGVQAPLKERLMRAYFTEGQSIAEHDVLAKLAGEVDIAEADARETLASDRFTDDVRGDEQMAGELGIQGVPFYVLGGRLGLSGAQPPDVMLQALERAWQLSSTTADAGESDQHAEPER